MKKNKYIIFIGLFIILIASVLIYVDINRSNIHEKAPGKKVSALFIGNSYTSVNDLPKMISDIASSRGNKLEYDSNTPGSYTFEKHVNDAQTLAKINNNNWDFVILQEQSQMPALETIIVENQVETYAKQLDKIINSKNNNTQTVFYETWGRKDGDPELCKTITANCNYAGMQNRIIASYEKMSQDLDADLAPVGKAWLLARKNHPEINLYQADGSHPSKEGSYLAACVFYITLFKDSVTNANNLGIDKTQAKYLQEIAQQSISN